MTSSSPDTAQTSTAATLISTITAAALLGATLLFSGLVRAHEHQPGTISGPGIELFERSHGFAGSILEHPVFGAFEHEPFGGKIQVRHGERTLALALADADGVYQGSIADGRHETRIELVKVQKTGTAEGRITLRLDGQEVAVRIAAKTFDNNHFQEPRFEAVVTGKPVAFAFSGQACFGYSSNLAMLILGAYAHLAKSL